ncbi:MAG TPA: amidohydrolase family protein, partial [Kofleriaceae bacterium]|nr:amidohydrolase family protein [Kofleriaceae bacterium]
AGSSITGLCFGRRPDGGAWSASAIVCSPGASNGGGGGGLLLRGTLLAPGGAYDGEVLVVGDTIACVGTSCSGAPGAAGASIVDTGGVILPGLIDVHNHVLYDIFDENDWTPAQLYTNHNQWPNEARYKAMVDAKQYLNGEGSSTWDYGCEMDKYGELKGLIAGTTSIVGAAITSNRGCYGSLSRTIDQSPNDLGFDKVQTSALFPISTSTADAVCDNIMSGATDAYVAHVAEGTDAVSLDEFARLGTVTTLDECLYAPQTTIVHGTALQAAQFDVMAARSMSLVWSPRVNVFLYGGGTDLAGTSPNIPLARAKGVNVALGADWSVGGSVNLLEELRFANHVDDQVWGNQLSSRDLVTMATANAAVSLGLDTVIGSLAVGMKADIAVIAGDRTHPYDAVLAARPANVKMTIVGGVLLYGDLPYESLAPAAPGCEHLDICGVQKFACVAESDGTASNKLGQTYAEIRSALVGALQSYDNLDLSAWNFAPIAPLVRCE